MSLIISMYRIDSIIIIRTMITQQIQGFISIMTKPSITIRISQII
ncbi:MULTISPECIES: hypothetical protein [Nitrosomonas]|nr:MULTISPECIES: hypothetical protein [Nitrosomonas]HNR09987.1 hypothetical protein [Nitrosomonas europaea]HRO57218.1 hypothetical protein [Nitrosomonas europaea]HUM74121.1 hypothetical protein [Nitrosomonas europaea]